jgi:hypothetical protein
VAFVFLRFNCWNSDARRGSAKILSLIFQAMVSPGSGSQKDICNLEIDTIFCIFLLSANQI